MPRYRIKDAETGRSLLLEGDSPPTEQELVQIFASQSKSSGPHTESIGEPTETATDAPVVPPINIKLSPYQQADLAAGGKAPTGMESGTEFTTALATGIPKDIDRAESAVKGAAVAVVDSPPNIWNRIKGLKPGMRGYVPPIGDALLTDAGAAAIKPLVPIPKFESKPGDSLWLTATKEATNMLLGIAEFLETPLGAATGGTAAAGKMGASLVRYAFAADMIKTMAQQEPDIIANWNERSDAENTKQITRFLGTGVMAGLLTHPEWSAKPEKSAVQGPAATGESLRQPSGVVPPAAVDALKQANAPMTAQALVETALPAKDVDPAKALEQSIEAAKEPTVESKPAETASQVEEPTAPEKQEVVAVEDKPLSDAFEKHHGRAPTPEELSQLRSGNIELPQAEVAEPPPAPPETKPETAPPSPPAKPTTTSAPAEDIKAEPEPETAALDTTATTSETKPTDESRAKAAAGQPVENPPGLDVRTSPGESQGNVPAKQPRPISRPEVPASPEGGGSVETGGSAGEPGVRGGPGRSSDTPEQPVTDQQPSPTDAGVGTAKDISQSGAVELPPSDKNHILPRESEWIPKGDKSKVRANLAAIKLLKNLEHEKRNPSPEEKQVLAQYTGWGGLKQVFDEGKAAYRERDYERLWGDQKSEFDRWEKSWGKLYDEVKSSLTPEEWDKAAQSILNAHYTSRTVINGVWDAVHKLGFKGGIALEPAGGAGHFIGLQGEPSRAATKWAAIELDDISGRMLTKLYPESKVQVTGFEKARIPNNSVDLVISNFPFAKEGPSDARYPNLSLHNYFFARSIDAVKPGGIVAAITSNSTMDSAASKAARQYIAERADLVGAIRLPNTAFKENAGTEVTTDILFFRKRDGTPFKGEPFGRTVEGQTYKGEPIELNEYFKNHPDMMLGRMSLEGTMYGGQEPALLPTPGAELASQIKEAVDKLPEDAFGAQQRPGEAAPEGIEASSSKIGGLSIRDGKPAIAQPDGSFETPEWSSSSAKVAQAKSYIGIRDSTKDIIQRMLSADTTDEAIAESRGQLNRLYDDYVKKYGAVNERRSGFLDDDADFPLVLALEDANTKLIEGKDAKGKSWSRRVTEWTKSKLFSERTIFPREAPEHVDTAEDGYHVSMNFKGKVDPDYIAQLTGQNVEAVKQNLQAAGLAYENPKSGQWEPSWRYLSGRVRDKLAEARKFMADNPRYKVNVEALEKVQPEPIAFENIQFRLGSTFISPEVVQRFLREKLGLSDARVQFTKQTGNWHIEPGYAGTREAINTTTYGIHGIDADELVSLALNLKSPVVTKLEPRVSEEGKAYSAEVKDSKKSLEAAEKQEQVKRAFKEWVKQDPQSAKTIEKQYNETANGSRVPKFDPPSWTHYPNASSDIELREHQKRVVTRMLQDSTMLAHAVGTGKTYAMITAAMEQRRLGLAKKPMIVVQNATLEQFARSFKRLYPTAKILAPSVRQRDFKNRNRTMSMIATGDWDAVIVPQSFVNMLPDSLERQTTYINDQLSEMKSAEIEARAAEGKRSPKAADLQRAVKRLEKQLEDLADRQQDNVLNFEQLGVDSLFVDEAHNYKKLQFSTKMDNIKGLDTGASQRGFSMLMKVRAVQEANQGKNVTFATGTPVSNTIAEVWNMMRYLRPDILEQHGMKDFDSFAANFGDTVTQLEMSAGGTWKPVTRFAKYSNGPELIQAWRSVADVVTPEEVNLPGLPAIRGGKVRPVTVKQTPQVTAYVAQLRAELEAFDAMSGKQKRENSHIPLVVFGRAKKATLDMRLIDSSLPDEPGSKINAVAGEVARIHQESSGVKGAQMVFADLYQNPDGQFNLYDELKRKLVAHGIPEKEILVVTDDLTDAKREAAFQKLNDGDYRVAIGSTERMGTGINAQEHLVGLHHMDAPARPMDIEQRNGRAWRQGNQNPIVDLVSYGVENTLDAALFQRLATKQRFINQILRGDVQGRNFEDAANEISMSYDEQMAAFSGDPLALEKVTLENQVRTLEALREGHFQQVRRARDDLSRLTTSSIPQTERNLEQAKIKSQSLKSEFSDMDKVPVKFGERTFTNKKEAVKFLDERLSSLSEAAKKSVLELHKRDGKEHSLNSSPSGFTIGSLPIDLSLFAETRAAWADAAMTKMTTEAAVKIGWNIKDQSHWGGTVTTGSGFYTSLESVLRRIENEPAEITKDLESRKRQVLQLQSFVGLPFERESELQKVSSRYQEVLGKIQKSSESSKAKTTVTPLGMEVELSKPLDAQRQQIRNILDRIDTRIKDDELPENYKSGIVDALKARLREIEEGMMKEMGSTPKQPTLTPEPSNINTGKLGNVGMGGAKPGEFGGSPETPTSIKNRIVDEERAKRGLPPAMQPARKSFGAVWDEAMARIDHNPDAQDVLMDELRQKPRALTDVEDALLLHRQIELQNQYGRATRELAQAFDDAKEFPNRLEAVEEGRLEVARLSDQLLDLYNLGKKVGTETGRGLNARKMMAYEDFTLAHMELEKRAANGGRPLTDAERTQLTDLQQKIEATQKAYDEYVAKTDARIAEMAMAQKLLELKVQSVPKFDKRILDYAETVVSRMEKAAAPAAARIRERLMRMGTSPDPTLLYDLSIVGSAKIARLGLDLAKFTDAMVKDFGDKIKPFINDVWDASNKMLESTLSKVPSAVKRAVKTQDIGERETAITDTIKKRMDEGKRNEIAGMVQKLARLFVERGIKERDPLIDAVHNVLKTIDPDFTRRETMDAISGYGDFRQLTKDQISVELRDLKGQMQQVSKLEDMQMGKPPVKTGLERRVPSREESRLIKLVNEAKQKFQIPITDPDTQLKSSLDTLKTSLANRTLELQEKLANKDFAPRVKRELHLDAEALRLKAEHERAKQEFQAGLIADRLKNRTWWEKALDWSTKWRRAGVLSSPVVIPKLISAGIQRMAFSPVEEVLGSAWGRLPGIAGIARRAPLESGTNLHAESNAFTKAFTKGMSDAWQVLRTGKSDLDAIYGKPDATYTGEPSLGRNPLEFFGRLHGLVKAPVKRAAFERATVKLTDFYLRQGLNPAEPMTAMRIGTEAFKAANRAIFLQDNFVADRVKRFVNSFEEKSKITGRPTALGKTISTAGRVAMPILRVPTNIVAETLQYAGGLITGGARVARALSRGVETLTPEEADLIMRDLKKGSIGAAFLTLGYLSPEVVGGYYQPQKKQTPGDVKYGSIRVYGHDIPSVLLHNPLLETIQLGATIRRVSDSYLRKKDTETQGLPAGVMAGVLGLTEEVPFIREMTEVEKLRNPYTRGGWINEQIKSILIPQIVQWLAKKMDKDTEGETVKRDPKTLGEHLQTGIPGMRGNVPVKKGAAQPAE